MIKIIVLNYENSSVDIIDYQEDENVEDWLSKYYDLQNCCYLITEDSNLTLNFINSKNIK